MNKRIEQSTQLSNHFNLARSIYYYDGVLRHCLCQPEQTYVVEAIRAIQQIFNFSIDETSGPLKTLLNLHKEILLQLAKSATLKNCNTIIKTLLSSSGVLHKTASGSVTSPDLFIDSIEQVKPLLPDLHTDNLENIPSQQTVTASASTELHQPLP